MRRTTATFLLGTLLLATLQGAAQPQPGVTQAVPRAVPGGIAGQAVPAPAIPLPAGSDEMTRRIRAYIATRGAQLLPRSALVAAGLSAENDAVEQGVRVGGAWMAPHHVGLAGTAAPPALAVDPAALAGARAAARLRVGHDPTDAEVAQDLAAFDQQIARINQGLAQHQAEIAAAYKQTGRFPRGIEAPLLGVTTPTARLADPTPAVRTELRRVLTILLTEPATAVPAPAPAPAIPR